MKKKFLLKLLFFLSMSISIFHMFGNSYRFYEDAWSFVNKNAASNPETAVKKLEEVIAQAEKEKNYPQMLAAIVKKGKVSERFSDSSFVDCLNELHDCRAQINDSAALALSFYLEVQMLKTYFSNNRTLIFRRTDLADTVPDDINEWTKNIFVQKIRDLTLKVLDEPAIKKVEAKSFAPLIVFDEKKNSIGEGAKLYDFIVNDIATDLDSLFFFSKNEIQKLLSDLVAFHQNDSDKTLYVQAKLDYLDEKFPYEEELDDWQYHGDDFVLEHPYYKEMEAFLKELGEDENAYFVREVMCYYLMEYLDGKENNPAFRNSKLPQVVYDLANVEVGSADDVKLCELRSYIDEIKRKHIRIEHNATGVLHSGKPLKFRVMYANMDSLKLTIYRDTRSLLEKKRDEDKGLKDRAKFKNYAQKVADYEFKLSPSNYFILEDTTVEIAALPYGLYYVDVEGKNKEDGYLEFSVTDIFGLSLQQKNQVDYVFVDSKSGAPLDGVSVTAYWGSNRENVYSFGTSGKDGVLDEAKIPDEMMKNQRSRVEHGFKRGDDAYHNWEYVYRNGPLVNQGDNTQDFLCNIFFDRAIYRPGQVVRFKAICYKLAENGSAVIQGENCKFYVIGANGQRISELSLVTNEFGSVSGSFVLPMDALSGRYTILSGRGSSEQFRVEEYKRPTFEVNLDRPTTSFSFGDSVTVSGHADYLFGAPLTAGKVKYEVTRKLWFWRWFGSSEAEKVVSSGEVELSKDGKFDIPFVAERGEKKGLSCYRYEVKVKVTDENGESQEELLSVYVGDRSMAFRSSLGERCLMEDLTTAKFYLLNLEGVGMKNFSIHYEVGRLDKNEVVTTVASGEVKSDEKGAFTLPLSGSDLLSGSYQFVFKAKDDKKRDVEETFKTILYRKEDKRPPVYSVLWQEDVKSVSLAYGEKHTVRIGSSLKDAHLLVVSINAKGEKKLKWVKLNDEIRTFDLMLQKEDGEAKSVHFYLVHNGSLHSAGMDLNLKEEDKSLPIELAVFRDNLLPGAEETWTVTVPKERKAEVLATMYDASLDLLAPLSWNFNPKYRKFYNFRDYGTCNNHDALFFETYSPLKNNCSFLHYVKYHFMDLPSGDLNRKMRMYSISLADDGNSWFFEAKESEEALYDHSVSTMKAHGASPKLAMGNNSLAEQGAMKKSDLTGSSVVTETVPVPVPTEEVKVRSNFAETAFFFPHMESDSAGNVKISFQIPESLTRWNFMLLSHTKDLYYGQKKATVITQKPFMVSANLPRFFRDGDKIALTAKVTNLSEVDKKGSVKILLLDPVTEAVVAENSGSFDVKQKETAVVSLSFDMPDTHDALIVRTIAKGDDFSDAEQKMVPVLPNRTVVTQSMPLYVRGGQTKTYRFENLLKNQSPTLRNNFLKLEFSTNPVWYAVQAMPSVATIEHENATSLSAAHFVSLMAHHIATSNPRIFNVIELWKKNGGDANTLLSQLEKNQEVKNILLNETPWVMEAKNETERKQRLATLFDLNDLKQKGDVWVKKLADYRLADGGYAWFKGCDYSSLHTSLFVVDNIGRLRKAGLDIKDVEKSLNVKATLHYLDGRLREVYDNMKKWKLTPHCSSSTLYYFQVRSLFPDVSLKEGTKEAYDYYFKLMAEKDEWENFSLYEKSLAAIALHRGGKSEVAKKIVESLREHSSTTDEMGMYWKKNTSGWLWSESAIATHTRIMEALELVDPKRKEQDNMRIWLLNQKRTQDWGNTIANIDALNVFLLSGSNWISNDNVVEVKMDGEIVKPEKTEVGTGYFEKNIPGELVKPSMGEVTLTSKKDGNLSWGALYWQFEEDYAAVPKSKTALQVERMVMLETKNVDGTALLKKIDKNTTVKVGDKVTVRLTLRTDRDMDYVMLKDQRAAALEPQKQLSGYRYSDGIGYYYSPKDAAVYYFFDHLAKGTYVFEYSLYATHAGTFSSGLATAQCLYAPEFLSNTDGFEIKIIEMR